MTGRDRMVVIVLVLAVALGAAWMLLVSPERQQASKLSATVSAAQAQLATAEGKVASARAAQSQYAAAYASVVNLGKAVPPSQEVPALIEQLSQASDQKHVDFASIAASTGTSPAAASSLSASASAAASGFSAVPFTFTFEGSYFDLEHLLHQVGGFTTLTASGELQVSGRLLTIQSVKLAPANSSSQTAASAASNLTGSITATAYVLPASQGLTGATGAAAGAGAPTAASSSAPASSPTAPAIVRINP